MIAQCSDKSKHPPKNRADERVSLPLIPLSVRELAVQELRTRLSAPMPMNSYVQELELVEAEIQLCGLVLRTGKNHAARHVRADKPYARPAKAGGGGVRASRTELVHEKSSSSSMRRNKGGEHSIWES